MSIRSSDSVIRIASLSKLMTSEMLVKLLDQGVVKLNDPLSKYAPSGASVPTYNGTPITLVNRDPHQLPAARTARWCRASSGLLPGQRSPSAGTTCRRQSCMPLRGHRPATQSRVRSACRCAGQCRCKPLSAAF